MLTKIFTETLSKVMNSYTVKSRYTPPLIYYGAGLFAAHFSKELEKLDIHPICYSDKDTSKHGTMLNGKKVLPIHEAIAHSTGGGGIADYLLLVTTMPEKWNEITDDLIESGIPRDRIINKIMVDDNPDLVIWGCYPLFARFQVRNENMTFCCYPYNKRRSKLNHQDYGKSIDDFMKMRADTLSTFNSGEKHNLCEGCPFLKKQVWLIDKIHTVCLAHGYVCNFNCFYCNRLNKNGMMSALPTPDYRLLMETLKSKELLGDNLFVDVASDEITAQPDCDEILSVFETIDNIYNIATNASIYSEKIYDILSSNLNSRICVSMDAGTRETFHKIKGRDAWEKVCKNVTKYSNSGANTVILKYIVLPGINDSLADANGFLELCKKANIRKIWLSSDRFAPYEGIHLTENALLTLEYIIKSGKDNGFAVELVKHCFTPKDLKRLSTTL